MNFEFTTDRLLLKVLSRDSAVQVLDFYLHNSDIFENYEPIYTDNFYTVSHQERILDYEYKQTLNMNLIRYYIFKKDNPTQIIGTVSFRNIVRPIYSSCTVGYKMDRDFTNFGYCTEALSFLIPRFCKDMDIHRVEATVLPTNTASMHILEKLGFVREGLLRDKIMIKNQRMDHFLYSYLY